MPMERLQETLLRDIEIQPGILLDILIPAEQQPGGYHQEPESSTPDWCVCGRCRQMPTDREKKCCQKQRCITEHANLEVLILNEGVLTLARLYRRDVFVFKDEIDTINSNRHQAYRQFLLWTYGRLTTGDRRVIPSCCIWKIRDKFPESFVSIQDLFHLGLDKCLFSLPKEYIWLYPSIILSVCTCINCPLSKICSHLKFASRITVYLKSKLALRNIFLSI